MFKDTTGKTISSIVINIGNPALIIASGMNPERLENKGKLLFTLGVALIYFAIMLALSMLRLQLCKTEGYHVSPCLLSYLLKSVIVSLYIVSLRL